MSIKKIRELVELMNDNGLTEVEVEQEGLKIRLIRRAGGVVEQVVTTMPQAVQHIAPQTEAAAQPEAKKKNTTEVKSPMVGTFYSAPSPDTDQYVHVGDVVQKGDVLCIVEAMKLMNEVKAEFGGRIVEICVENAEAVEYGQTIFVVEPV